MMSKSYKTVIDRIMVNNRWKRPSFSRPDDWTIIGIRQKWYSPIDYEIRFCLFGYDIIVRLKKEFLTGNT